MHVSVIVVNLNKRDLTLRCLEALARQDYADYEVILVDNRSADGTVSAVREAFPSVRMVALDTNRGFAAAVNAGIREARGDLIATLNNDAFADPRWLSELVAAVQTDERAGMAASKMLFFDRPEVINSAGICIDRVGIAWDRFGGQRDGDGESDRSAEIFGPCAGAALYRRSLLEDAGVFDEDFFLYLEDVDLAWRAQARGWKCLYAPKARVSHLHSASAREGSAFKRFLLAKNKVLLVVKDYPNPQFAAWLPLIVFYDVASALYGMISSKDLASLKGRLAAIAGLRGMLEKRWRAQRQRLLGFGAMAHLFAPVSLPWRVRRRYEHLGKQQTGLGNSGGEG